MTILLDALSLNVLRFQSAVYDYEYIGPGKNEVPWFDLFVVAFCIFAVALVVRGVIDHRRNR